MIGLKKGMVHLEAHDPEWEKEGQRMAARLHEILGAEAIDIQHVGSTAIRTIPAKPFIDIAVAVPDVENTDAYLEKMEAAGFEYEGELNAGQRMFMLLDPKTGKVTHHIHMVLANGAAWKNYLNMRDYLNAVPEEAARYAQMKRELEAKYSENRAEYSAHKDPFIKATLKKAAEWRKTTEK